MSGKASGTTVFSPGFTDTTTAQQDTDWYGTVRGRLGWLSTPNVLLFGTGGFASGRVDGSLSYSSQLAFGATIDGFQAICGTNVTCFAGSSSAIRAGWTAGGRGGMAA